MPDHSNDIKLALWRNDKRDKPTQPILKGGKPQVIGGQEYWVSAWINAPKDNPEIADKIQKMVDVLAQLQGTYPIINVNLSPAEQQGYAPPQSTGGGVGADPFGDEIPFSPIRGLVE